MEMISVKEKLKENLLSLKSWFLMFVCVMFVLSFITFSQLLIVAAGTLGLRFTQQTLQIKNGKKKEE